MKNDKLSKNMNLADWLSNPPKECTGCCIFHIYLVFIRDSRLQLTAVSGSTSQVVPPSSELGRVTVVAFSLLLFDFRALCLCSRLLVVTCSTYVVGFLSSLPCTPSVIMYDI